MSDAAKIEGGESQIDDSGARTASSAISEPPGSAKRPLNFCAASVPIPRRILGLNLKPLSLGHVILMERFGCALVTGGEPTFADLALGVLICSLTYEDFLAFLNQPDCRKEIQGWGKTIGLTDLAGKFQLFRDYLDESMAEPAYVKLRDFDESTPGDWKHNLKVTLMSQLGWTEDRAMNGPLRAALADFYQFAQTEGILRLVQAGEKEEADANTAKLKEWLAAAEKAESEKRESENPDSPINHQPSPINSGGNKCPV